MARHARSTNVAPIRAVNPAADNRIATLLAALAQSLADQAEAMRDLHGLAVSGAFAVARESSPAALMTVSQTAARLSVSPASVRRMIASGELHPVRPTDARDRGRRRGTAIRVRASDVDAIARGGR